jgi:hypothetical protein
MFVDTALSIVHYYPVHLSTVHVDNQVNEFSYGANKGTVKRMETGRNADRHYYSINQRK